MKKRPHIDSASIVRIDLENALTPDLFDWLLRPFWAEEYQKTQGEPGVPARLKQFLEPRGKAVDRLETELGIAHDNSYRFELEEFLLAYEAGLLPINCHHKVQDSTIVDARELEQRHLR